jgi:hypothetical protein
MLCHDAGVTTLTTSTPVPAVLPPWVHTVLEMGEELFIVGSLEREWKKEA